ncbi:hypothetical protein [Candidatus Nanohalococcus occultus]|uniref:Uncharacterized protein n=1 Tax=Candidatus Nanohalococcus occultus TaxID=2978047 RepID=A0ABY8CDH7_9ARCH|nr:hypothetical protein SVXNc_0249 [Candidatus Nanohaloarchaeota archaeon SVXNc]
MDRTALLLLILALVPAATSVDFKVNVAGQSGDAVFNANSSTSGDLHRFNATLENPSSVGCQYHLRGEFTRGNLTERRYSNAYRMWPGETSDIELSYVPVNYTGQVRADIDLMYCDTTRNISDYAFNVSNPAFNNTYASETLEVTENSATASFSLENATLVPVQAPSYWKVGSTSIVNRTAQIDYTPTLFQEEKQIQFAVIQNNSIEGTTTVLLESPPPTLKEKLLDKQLEIIAGLLAFSLLANLFMARKKILPDKVLEKLSEIETNRSIRN